MTTTPNTATSMSYDVAQGILVTLDDAGMDVARDISATRDIASFTITVPGGEQFTVAVSPARPAPAQLRPATGLTVGMVVRHTSPELADWEGQIQVNRNREWIRREGDGTEFYRVAWYAGLNGDGKRPQPGWVEATALRAAESA